eukprot:3425511-Pleurochrysis_carterae.AAC.1
MHANSSGCARGALAQRAARAPRAGRGGCSCALVCPRPVGWGVRPGYRYALRQGVVRDAGCVTRRPRAPFPTITCCLRAGAVHAGGRVCARSSGVRACRGAR